MKNSKTMLARFKRDSKESSPSQADEPTSGRVTNETVIHHRDEVLNKGRRFKYPFQRSKHKVAFISIGLALLAVLLLGGFTGLQLYRWQSTSDFTYKVTQILPFPVAKVNGSYTSYESYLFELKSSLHWQEKYGTTDHNSPDGKRQVEYLKYSALDQAMQNTIAHSLARKNNIHVSNQEVDAVVSGIKTNGGNLQQIIGEQFDFTETELRRYIKDNILRQKVARQLDTTAPKHAAQLLAEIKAGKSFAAVAQESSDDLATKQLGGDLGVVERNHANLPPQVAQKIFQLKVGEVSDVISTSSDYYIVMVTEKVDENRAKVSIIQVKVKDMSQYLQDYQKAHKVSEYIKLKQVNPLIQN